MSKRHRKSRLKGYLIVGKFKLSNEYFRAYGLSGLPLTPGRKTSVGFIDTDFIENKITVLAYVKVPRILYNYATKVRAVRLRNILLDLTFGFDNELNTVAVATVEIPPNFDHFTSVD